MFSQKAAYIFCLKSKSLRQFFEHNFPGSNKPTDIYYRFYQDWNHISALAVITG